MIDRILTVGGITLLSRVTGFLRDIMLAAVLGAGPVADAFFVALRLPNHFRAIFAEGAFNAAFIPAYARVRVASGPDAVRLFADRVFALLAASQVVLLAVALLFTPWVIDLLAPGFSKDPGRFALAVDLTRITFPYLLLVSLVTLYGGILNALDRFAAAAAAPILLNLSMMMTLALAAFFPDRRACRGLGRAARGISGVPAGRRRCGAPGRAAAARLAAHRPGGDAVPEAVRARRHRLGRHPDRAVRRHHHRQLPRHRRLSALYYADRLNQLPIGVIGIAAGTVLLPEMAKRITAGDEAGARHSQNRAIELTLLLSVPCLVAFLIVPELIMRGLFGRGAFTAADAHAAALTLMAYAIGLLPFVLMRSVTATFLARGDTTTPVKALFVAVAVNVVLKVLLMDRYAQIGLAFATSVGAWINLALLVWFSARQNFLVIDPRLRRSTAKFAIAGVILGAVLLLGQRPVRALFAGWTSLRDEMTLLVLAAVGAIIYGIAIRALFHREWRTLIQGR